MGHSVIIGAGTAGTMIANKLRHRSHAGMTPRGSGAAAIALVALCWR